MIFWQLFYTFFIIGLLGFGGGYGMLSLIQNQVVDKFGWISASEFTDIVAVSQITPGPIGINSATYVGYMAVANAGYTDTAAVAGSLLASASLMLPSFILMLIVSIYFMRYSNSPAVQFVLSWLRIIVVGLLAAAAISLVNRQNFGSDFPQLAISCVLFGLSLLLSLRNRCSPILIIIGSGIIGGLVYSFI